ncbi:hypothetical protein GMRT_15307 [Giardia muris]|uniref:PATROL1-like C-terminal domain-containing protein n=1 Tax=Giardia muris TaxID=5742 RepID=A0A4Z1T6X7_GIAMU|nr:hypothetical protein GMRT_15307 [Giardia muris]|eukprot:TNJ28887.1 hypothetical protein GMRT_15307 [Giardia muris]
MNSDVELLLGYLLLTDPKLSKVRGLPSEGAVDVPALVALLRDPTVKVIDKLPLSHAIDDSNCSEISIASSLAASSSRARSLASSAAATPTKQPLRPGRSSLRIATKTVNLSSEGTDYSVAPPLDPLFVQRAISFHDSFHLTYCVSDLWILFSGLYTSPQRLRRASHDAPPRAAAYGRMIDDATFFDVQTAMRANLNLPVGDLVSLAVWMQYAYKQLLVSGNSATHFTTLPLSSQTEEETNLAASQLISFASELDIVALSLYALLKHRNNVDLQTWLIAEYSEALERPFPYKQVLSSGNLDALISEPLLINYVVRHTILLSASLLNQINTQFGFLADSTSDVVRALGTCINKLSTLANGFASRKHFVGSSLNVSLASFDTETDTSFKSTSADEPRLVRQLCTCFRCVMKIIALLVEVVGDVSVTSLLERMPFITPALASDFSSQFVRLLVYDSETKQMYDTCRKDLFAAYYQVLSRIHDVYFAPYLPLAEEVYDPISGCFSKKNAKTPGYDAHKFFLSVLSQLPMEILEEGECLTEFHMFLQEYVSIDTAGQVDLTCDVLEPYLSDYTRFSLNPYPLRYTLSLLMTVFQKYNASPEFLELGLTPLSIKEVLGQDSSRYIFQVRLQKYMQVSILRQLMRLYCQAEADTEEMNLLSVEPEVEEISFDDLNAGIVAVAGKGREKPPPCPIMVLAKMLEVVIDQITVELEVFMPIFTEFFFKPDDSSISKSLWHIYVAGSFCMASRLVSKPLSAQVDKQGMDVQCAGLYALPYCDYTETDETLARVSPMSIFSGLLIRFLSDRFGASLSSLTMTQHYKLKFTALKTLLGNLDTVVTSLGNNFFSYYLGNGFLHSWLADGHERRIDSLSQIYKLRRALAFLFPADTGIILATPLLSYFILNEAGTITGSLLRIYKHETNLTVQPFNWLIEALQKAAPNSIGTSTSRCGSLHYNASSAPIDGIEPVMIFLESIFSSVHLSDSSLRSLFSQVLELVRTILKPVRYNAATCERHALPPLMQVFSIAPELQSRHMMKQSRTRRGGSATASPSVSERSFTSSALSAQIITQKGFRGSLAVGASIAAPELNERIGFDGNLRWAVDTVNSPRHERHRSNANHGKGKPVRYEDKLVADEAAITSILPMGSGVPTGALLFSSFSFMKDPETFSDIIQACRVLTYRINSLEVLLARVGAVYEYVSNNTVTYELQTGLDTLETTGPLDMSQYWLTNLKRETAKTRPTDKEHVLVVSYFTEMVQEINVTLEQNIEMLAKYLLNTGLRPLIQRAYCPVVAQTQLQTAWSGLEIALRDIYRNLSPAYILKVANAISAAAVNAHLFILLDSGPRARTIALSDAPTLAHDFAFLKDVLIGRWLYAEEYLPEYRRLYRCAAEYGLIRNDIPGLHLTPKEVGVDYDGVVLPLAEVEARCPQLDEVIRLHGLSSAELISTSNIGYNYAMLEELDVPKNLEKDMLTHSEFVCRILNFRRYCEPGTRDFLHALRRKIQKINT